jgi:hypothetical protein
MRHGRSVQGLMAKSFPLLPVVILGSSLLLSGATRSESQAPPPLRTEGDIQDLCENALSHIVDGEVAKGIAVLRPYALSISKSDMDSLENQLLGQAETIKESYGDPIGYVLISRVNLKDTVLKTVYVVKYERHLIRWTFIFYKPYDSWILDFFNYDDSIEDLFTPRAPAPAK